MSPARARHLLLLAIVIATILVACPGCGVTTYQRMQDGFSDLNSSAMQKRINAACPTVRRGECLESR